MAAYNRRPAARRLAVLVSAIFLATTPAARPYEQEVKALAADMAQRIAKGSKKSAAVVDFTDLQGNVTELGRFLAEEFSVSLALHASDFEVIDRTHLRILLEEHKLSASGLIDPQTARKLGQIAGVDALVTGSITPFGDSVRLSLKVLDTATARLVGVGTAEIPKTRAIEELLSKGIGAGGVAFDPRGASHQPAGDRTSGAGPGTAKPSGVSARLGDFLILVRRCERAAGVVTCMGQLTNKSAQQKQFAFNDRETFVVDDLGDKSEQTQVSFGGERQYQQNLSPELPMNFSLRMTTVNPSARSVSLAVRCFGCVSGSIGAFGPEDAVLVRGIQLVQEE